MTQTLLVIGNDKAAFKAASLIKDVRDVRIVIDQSTSLKRVIRLIRRGSLSIPLVLKMLWAETRRANYPAPENADTIKNGADLVALIKKYNPSRVVLFRAGLIIGKPVLATGVAIMNIHCAKVPEYGGIGVIARALNDNAYDQWATLHQVTEEIDRGTVFDTETYRLDPKHSYGENENAAYDAGIRLLTRTISG